MKKIILLTLLFSSIANANREVPMTRIPLCFTWIPESNIWGCTHLQRTDVATRATIEVLVEEIKELKARVQKLEEAASENQ